MSMFFGHWNDEEESKEDFIERRAREIFDDMGIAAGMVLGGMDYAETVALEEWEA